MKNKVASFLLVIFGFLPFFGLFVFGQNPLFAMENKERYSENYNGIIVKYKNDPKIYQINISENRSIENFIKDYENKLEVEFAEPNYTYRASIIPSDTYYSNQWYLQKIKAPQAWDTVRESENIVIAIIDSGVQIDHPDLRENIWKNKKEIAGNGIDDDKNGFIDDVNGWDFVDNTPDPRPKFSEGYTSSGILHGTIVAGIAAASGNNAAGISGVTWRAKIMPLRVLDDKGEGDTNNVVKAVDYAIANGADIINFSFVGFGNSQALERAIRRAYEAGIVIVAAAGNEQDEGDGYFLDETPMYPVCHDGLPGENMVIGVAATDALDQKASFSSHGFKCVDISAPGVSFFSTSVYSPQNANDDYAFNKYYDGYWSGTSMATPLVSGAISLLMAAAPGFGRNEISAALFEGTDNINRLNQKYLGQMGSGRINLNDSVLKIKKDLDGKEMKILTSRMLDGESVIAIRAKTGIIENEINAYDVSLLGGVNLASGDIDGNGIAEIISAAGAGGGPHVRIFDFNGNPVSQFFAYDKNFRGGVNVAVGDVDGDGVAEIITGAGAGGGPHVRIFGIDGNVKSQFFAYDKNFRGGVNVAVGDVDGDGIAEIITGAGAGGGPHVRIFDSNGNLKSQFFAYDKNFRGGINVAFGKFNGNERINKGKIATAPMSAGGPHVKIFDLNGRLLNHFFAYDAKFRGGVTLAAIDVDNDTIDELMTGAGPGGGPHVRVFGAGNQLKYSFYAYENDYSGGVNVGSIKY